MPGPHDDLWKMVPTMSLIPTHLHTQTHTLTQSKISGAKTDISLLLTSPHKTEDVSALLSHCQTVKKRQRKTDRQERRDQGCSTDWERKAMTSSWDKNGNSMWSSEGSPIILAVWCFWQQKGCAWSSGFTRLNQLTCKIALGQIFILKSEDRHYKSVSGPIYFNVSHFFKPLFISELITSLYLLPPYCFSIWATCQIGHLTTVLTNLDLNLSV